MTTSNFNHSYGKMMVWLPSFIHLWVDPHLASSIVNKSANIVVHLLLSNTVIHLLPKKLVVKMYCIH
jgi:hypothetical protein